MEADFLYMNHVLCPKNTAPFPVAAPGGPVRRVWIALVALMFASDYLFYDRKPGISVAAMGLLLVAALLWNRRGLRWNAPRVLGLLFILGSLVQSAVETSFSNSVVLVVLFSVAMVEAEAAKAGLRPSVLALALTSWLRCLGRWLDFIEASAGAFQRIAPKASGQGATRAIRVVIPGLLVLVPFALLFASGNAVLSRNLSVAMDALGSWTQWLRIPTASRTTLWVVSAVVILPYLRPKLSAHSTNRTWPSFAVPADPAFARWRTWFLLGAVNLLFFWANSLDAVFLWLNTGLPEGVTYSEFVHEGVFSLTTVTLLAGATLTFVLQQDGMVSQHRATRALANGWIVQNLLLIASVALRLKLYTDAYGLTVQRCGVWAFLALVAAGFLLLSKRVAHDMSLNWLVRSNAIAVVGLFYLLQFVDLKGVVAQYNTNRWFWGSRKTIDIEYLSRLGPSGWPSLARISGSGRMPEAGAAMSCLTAARVEAAQSPHPWQSWQWHDAAMRKEVFSNPPWTDRP